MMNIFESALLGVVEGVTEFLPISSTGHLILASSLLGIAQSDFQKTFEIAIQLGAILAVVALYWRSFLDLEVLKRIAVAFIPTGIVGFALYSVIKNYLLASETVVLWALFLGGVALIAFEYWHRERPDAREDMASMSYATAALIGLCQSVAVIPGVSRSAATILGGLALGLKRTTIVEFSFLLAAPTMAMATVYDLLKNPAALSGGNIAPLLIGFIVSFVVAMLSIKWLLSYVRKHSFIPFGMYRIAAAALFFLLVLR